MGLLAVAGGSGPRLQGERVGVRKCLIQGGVQVGGDVPRFIRLEGSSKDGYDWRCIDLASACALVSTWGLAKIEPGGTLPVGDLFGFPERNPPVPVGCAGTLRMPGWTALWL